jgi:predicted nucleic acid-binding protein
MDIYLMDDLWIAATAKVANATLLTIDGDFDHLHMKFIEVKKYQQQINNDQLKKI